jgi:hypothetical protein
MVSCTSAAGRTVSRTCERRFIPLRRSHAESDASETLSLDSSNFEGTDVLSAEREREFQRWVRDRLSTWTSDEIRAFDRWLLAESHFEFIPAVRAAWTRRRLEELDLAASPEPAA